MVATDDFIDKMARCFAILRFGPSSDSDDHCIDGSTSITMKLEMNANTFLIIVIGFDELFITDET